MAVYGNIVISPFNLVSSLYNILVFTLPTETNIRQKANMDNIFADSEKELPNSTVTIRSLKIVTRITIGIEIQITILYTFRSNLK